MSILEFKSRFTPADSQRHARSESPRTSSIAQTQVPPNGRYTPSGTSTLSTALDTYLDITTTRAAEKSEYIDICHQLSRDCQNMQAELEDAKIVAEKFQLACYIMDMIDISDQSWKEIAHTRTARAVHEIKFQWGDAFFWDLRVGDQVLLSPRLSVDGAETLCQIARAHALPKFWWKIVSYGFEDGYFLQEVDLIRAWRDLSLHNVNKPASIPRLISPPGTAHVSESKRSLPEDESEFPPAKVMKAGTITSTLQSLRNQDELLSGQTIHHLIRTFVPPSILRLTAEGFDFESSSTTIGKKTGEGPVNVACCLKIDDRWVGVLYPSDRKSVSIVETSNCSSTPDGPRNKLVAEVCGNPAAIVHHIRPAPSPQGCSCDTEWDRGLYLLLHVLAMIAESNSGLQKCVVDTIGCSTFRAVLKGFYESWGADKTLAEALSLTSILSDDSLDDKVAYCTANLSKLEDCKVAFESARTLFTALAAVLQKESAYLINQIGDVIAFYKAFKRAERHLVHYRLEIFPEEHLGYDHIALDSGVAAESLRQNRTTCQSAETDVKNMLRGLEELLSIVEPICKETDQQLRQYRQEAEFSTAENHNSEHLSLDRAEVEVEKGAGDLLARVNRCGTGMSRRAAYSPSKPGEKSSLTEDGIGAYSPIPPWPASSRHASLTSPSHAAPSPRSASASPAWVPTSPTCVPNSPIPNSPTYIPSSPSNVPTSPIPTSPTYVPPTYVPPTTTDVPPSPRCGGS